MCLLVYHKGKSKMTKEAFDTSFKANSDGVGFAVKKEGGLNFFKTLNKEEAYKYYLEAKDYDELVLHFRFGTSGGKEINMVHPFKLGGNSLLFHNGVITVPMEEGMSDTASLAHHIKSLGLSEEGIHGKAIDLLLGELVNGYNKFLVISINKPTKIWGINLGHWNDNKDIWYSNSGYKVGFWGKTDYLIDDSVKNNWLTK